MIHTRSLTKDYVVSRTQTIHAVRGISLDVRPGELVAVLGPNGAGKTTTMRMLTTLVAPSSGSATVAGHDVVSEPAAVRRRIGYVGQGNGAGHNQRVRDELHQRWAEILALPEDTRRVELRATDLAAKVHAAFAAPGPGWPTARHHSPDLMIAAAGPEALARGELTVILGEVHAGMNFVTLPTLAKEHVDPARLFAQRHAETGRTIGLVEPRANVRRASFYSLAEGDLDVELGDARSHRPRNEVFDVSGFVVTERDSALWVRRRDGSQEFDIVAFLEGDLNAESYNFDLLAPAPYRPRVAIDGFVIVRERWRVKTTELMFASQTAPVDRFVAARRWAIGRGLPRFLFMKAPSEPKPMYLDLESPVYVEILCKLARSDEQITLTEMLPTFDDLWLLDADGVGYCSELRMALVDDERWQPPVDPKPIDRP